MLKSRTLTIWQATLVAIAITGIVKHSTAAPMPCTGECEVSDGTARIEVDSWPEVDPFDFNGDDHMSSQEFHIRFDRGPNPQTLDPGTTNPEELEEFIAPTLRTQDEDANVIHLEYVELDGLDIRIDYTLNGGLNVATLNEVITIANGSSTDSFVLDLFVRTDWDLDGATPGSQGDTAEFVGTLANPEFKQVDGTIVTTTVADPISHFDVSEFQSESAYVGLDGNLQGRTTFGPGDAIYHLQFPRLTLAPGESATFNVHKTIQEIPEPTSLVLLGFVGAAKLLGRRNVIRMCQHSSSRPAAQDTLQITAEKAFTK